MKTKLYDILIIYPSLTSRVCENLSIKIQEKLTTSANKFQQIPCQGLKASAFLSKKETCFFSFSLSAKALTLAWDAEDANFFFSLHSFSVDFAGILAGIKNSTL